MDAAKIILEAVVFIGLPLALYIGMEKNMLLNSWYRFILGRLYFQVKRVGNGVSYIDKRKPKTIKQKIKRMLFKLLGGCVFCFGFHCVSIQSYIYNRSIMDALLTACLGVSLIYFVVFKFLLK